jgi:hypothetical protein
VTEAQIQQNGASRNDDQQGERDARQIPASGVSRAFHFLSGVTIGAVCPRVSI